MKVVKGNLDGSPEIDMNSMYLVDFSKCESVNDLMTILCIQFPESFRSWIGSRRRALSAIGSTVESK